MFSKILISGKIEVITGLHIGTGGDYSAIGAADSPVVRDAVSGLPMIPGSSLKGKLRTLLAKKLNDPSKDIRTAEDDAPEIKRLFGGLKMHSRLIFSDMPLCNADELKSHGIFNPTEIKYENTINRLTSVANPRQIERVIRGSKFELKIIYNAESKAETEEDVKLLAEGFKLLRYDYLGGSGSRGYGRVRFEGLKSEIVTGNDDGSLDGVTESCDKILEEVSADEI